MLKVVGDVVLLVPRDVGRRTQHGRQRRVQVVDRHLPDGRVADCVLHCDERYPELRKGEDGLDHGKLRLLWLHRFPRLFISLHCFHTSS